MAKPRPSRRSSASAPGSAGSSGRIGDDDAAAKKNKPRSASSSQFFPRWFVSLLFAAVAVVSLVDRRKRRVWRKALAEYLEPPPIGIKLTDRGRFNASEAVDDDDDEAAAAADPNLPPPSVAEEDDPNLLADHLGARLHVVFSTDCSPYQHWQSYLLFYSALRARQPGLVTRIASGCSDGDGARERRWFEEHVAIMSRRFRIHFTPRFSDVVEGADAGKQYKYFNKPFGLRHWMEHGEGMGLDPETGRVKDEDAVVILLDPDMILLRPITSDFSGDRDVIIPQRVRKDRKVRVEHGSPFGQAYGVGARWKDFDLDGIVGPGDSPAKDLRRMDGLLRYAVGPPYLATARDMHPISVRWTEFAPAVYREYPKLLAEMYGYCIAAAHLRLPHQKVESLMVSDVTLGAEGWPYVEDIPGEEVCRFAARPDHSRYPLPNVMHYCQGYSLGGVSFHKRKIDRDFFSCDGRPMRMPEDDAALRYNTTGRTRKGVYKVVELSPGEVKRVAFALCAARGAMNEALAYFRGRHCGAAAADADANGRNSTAR